MNAWMFTFLFYHLITLISFNIVSSVKQSETDNSPKSSDIEPTVVFAILVRNKAHALPYFFGGIERLNYPKHRIGLWIRSDHNIDNSTAVIQKWLKFNRPLYHSVDFQSSNEGVGYPDEGSPMNWTDARHFQLMRLRQLALKHARKIWADYLFVIDADVILVNENTLYDLIQHKDKTVVGPLLNCTGSDSFGNFWGDMTPDFYYKRSPDYFDIRRRFKTGILPVPMLHTAFLINLNHRVSLQLSFDRPPPDYNGPIDDIIIFSRVLFHAGLSFYLENTKFYGYFSLPLAADTELIDERDSFVHLKMEVLHANEGNLTLQPSSSLPVYLPPKSKLGFDKVYLINLARRTDRFQRMEYCLNELGIQADLFDAVDGQKLNKSYLDSLGIRQLEGYADPYHKRTLKMGEVGCFLSHYFIWQEMIDNNYETILLFEDDIRFQPSFVRQLEMVMNEANRAMPNWELLYIGRKRLQTNENYLVNSSLLVHPNYTYWTLSYIINQKGARKLIDQKPLDKLVAVDEYLPIMFDMHPREDWKAPFGPRNLVAISAEPLLVEPTHYTGAPFYISDTEDSQLVKNVQKLETMT